MTPVERAARALYRSAPHDFDPNEMGEDATWPDLVGHARAVIAAIREPSEKHVTKAVQSDNVLAWGDYPEFWQAMIDALLEEGR